jgi:hypothetical protein
MNLTDAECEAIGKLVAAELRRNQITDEYFEALPGKESEEESVMEILDSEWAKLRSADALKVASIFAVAMNGIKDKMHERKEQG